MISAFAPHFRSQFHLTATQTAFLVAVPVLLGALARIPIGMLADRFGGRAVFTVLMFFVAVPVALVPAATSYQNLLVVAFLLGMAGLHLLLASVTSPAGFPWRAKAPRSARMA